MGWDDNADAVSWDEAPEPLVSTDGYQQSDNAPLPPEDTDTPFIDAGESEATIFSEGYQQVDVVPPTLTPPPEDVPQDWSEVPGADFIASSYGNVDQPALVEETYFDEEIEHESWWWTAEDTGDNLPVQTPRQEGDSDFDLLSDDLAEDVTAETVAMESVLVPDIIGPPTVLMPNILGLPFEEGFTICGAVGLNLQSPPQQENVYYPFQPVPAGIIVQQFPLPLTPVAVGSTVYAVVSSGLIVYPDSATVNNGNPLAITIGDDVPV